MPGYSSFSSFTHIGFVFVQYMDEDLKVAGKYKGNDYSQYSPWSCDTFGSYIGTKDAKPKDIVAAGTVEMVVSIKVKPNNAKDSGVCVC